MPSVYHVSFLFPDKVFKLLHILKMLIGKIDILKFHTRQIQIFKLAVLKATVNKPAIGHFTIFYNELTLSV